jgi:outer membrane protein assembly factor BamB
LYVVEQVGSPPTGAVSGKSVVPALVRGVLYALKPGTGEPIWATRVGIDTTALPVHLPETASSKETFLVVSADRNTLRALAARTGELLWKYQLSAPCLGSPVVVGGRAYVPTYDGRVHEIEIFEGNRLGHFELGRPLSVGGAHQPGTDILYLPADSQVLFVLDLAKKECVGILQTGHTSGSLRSEPIVVNKIDPQAKLPESRAAAPGFLILVQSDGLEHVQLRVFGLPIERPDAQPVLRPEPRVRGWSWLRPFHDFEKLALATDAGVLGVYGIQQVRNPEDPPLFPLLRDEIQVGRDSSRTVRAQVVHASENDFWILARGDLQRLQLHLYKERAESLWENALPLGSPLHAAGLDEGGKTLFVVTQSPSQRSCLVTAVHADDGKVLWQRQVGVDCQSDPIVLGEEVLVLDRGGSLFVFDAARHAKGLKDWQVGGRMVAGPLEEGPVAPSLLRAVDGKSAYELAWPKPGNLLVLRHYQPGKPEATSTTHHLSDRLAGVPALGPDFLLLPLADGNLIRLPLDGGQPMIVQTWRAERADDQAVCHITYFNPAETLITDGLRTLTWLRWAGGMGVAVESATLPARIVAPPVVVSGGGDIQVFVADSSDTLTLLEGLKLKEGRKWKLPGKLTAGPFLREENKRIGCVVDRRRLVWIDPAVQEPVWTQDVSAEAIVGQPQVFEGMVVVADVSGRIIGLDPARGTPLGPGYTLKATAAPAATPVPFGQGRALVPLTDGTLFVLSLEHLRPAGKP